MDYPSFRQACEGIGIIDIFSQVSIGGGNRTKGKRSAAISIYNRRSHGNVRYFNEFFGLQCVGAGYSTRIMSAIQGILIHMIGMSYFHLKSGRSIFGYWLINVTPDRSGGY